MCSETNKKKPSKLKLKIQMNGFRLTRAVYVCTCALDQIEPEIHVCWLLQLQLMLIYLTEHVIPLYAAICSLNKPNRSISALCTQ